MTNTRRYLKGKYGACEAARGGGPGYGERARCEVRKWEEDAKDGGAHEDAGTRMGSGTAVRGQRGGAGVLMA